MRNLIISVSVLMLIQAVSPCPARGRVFQDEEEIVFQIKYPSAQKVYIVGDFNGWNPTMDKLVKRGDRFEIRLYLLPGRYSYRFNVDGKSIPDPDNSLTDGKGNSLIVVVQDGDNVKLQFSSAEGSKNGMERNWKKQLGGFALYDRYGGSFFSGVSIGDSLKDSFIISATVVSEANVSRFKSLLDQHPSLFRAMGRFTFSGTEFTAFHRMPLVDLGDPLGMVTSVGPFDYPVGIFSSGVTLKKKLPFGISGNLFAIDRTLDYDYGRQGTFSERAFKGNRIISIEKNMDVIGFSLSTKMGGVPVRYLFRLDRRPLRDRLSLPRYGNAVFDAYEKVLMSGFSAEIHGGGGSKIQAEYLGGRSTISVFERSLDGALTFDEYRADFRFEQGSQFLIGYSMKKGLIESGINIRSSMIGEVDSDKEKKKTTLKGFINLNSGDNTLKFSAKLKTFSPRSSLSYFQLRVNDFWLDGDALYPEDLPFLSSRSIFEMKAELNMGKGLPGVYPLKRDLLLSFTERRSVVDERRSSVEFRMGKLLAFHPLCNFIMDARYISYGYDGVRKDFTSTYIGYYLEVDSNFWLSIGFGVSPYTFDKLLYRYTGKGRERYIVDRGVLNGVGNAGDGVLLDSLFEAEDSMERTKDLHLDIGFNF